ncbi:MAG: S9 family peptidase [Deltaproteobacteria bacterium]|nr:S9 family peptidase [Deltaproteobacteria bacterium]
MTRRHTLACACALCCCQTKNPGAGEAAGGGARGTLAAPAPPVAARRPHAVVSPHGTRDDPYYWMRDDERKDPEVLAHLAAENAYANAVLAPVTPLEDTLFAELRARVQEEDSTVPVFDRGYWYYVRFETGKQYPIYARRQRTLDAPEQILLDGNVLAVGHPFFKIGNYAVSPDGRLLAWAEDTVGRNQFVLRIMDLDTGARLPDTAANISGALAWANDNRTLFYGGKDDVTLRADRVFRHVLGGTDVLVHHEPDGSYYVGVGTTKSHRFITIGMRSTTNSEYRLLDADAPAGEPRVFLAREKDHLYSVDHLGDRFVIRTNDHAKNFRVVEVPRGKEASDRAAWKEIIPHRADTLVESVALYDKFLAASVRTGGLRKVQVLPAKGSAFYIDAQDPAYVMSVYDTPDPTSTRVRYVYESMTQPSSVYELDIGSKQKALLKQQPVPTYDPALYTSDYLHAKAPDGTAVPISVVYRKGTKLDGSAPLLVYGYGSYGMSMEPSFGATRTSLLDRGWVYAIAHIRGGQEMGRAWYEDGKLMKKRNTFTDFIASTEHLVAHKYGAADRVFAMGGSAGGLLVGAVVNMRPDLYRGIVSFVPFVDVLTTMLDESIPLTTNEYEEWGNPTADKAAYDYMLGYSPYDNITPQPYPAIYVRTGLWDSQVQYFEPAKWVAKLRATKRDTNPVLFDINMSAGHGGASGRFDALREIARAYAFMLMTLERPDRRTDLTL